MNALVRAARVVCTVLVEAVVVVALVAIGRRPGLEVPVGHLGSWLREGDAATVSIALLRWVALLGAGWLLASTLLYLAAAASRVPSAVRAVRWSTLPAARRAIDAACAVSVATSVVLAPAAAGAVRDTGDTTIVTIVRDGRGRAGNGDAGGIAQLPPDSTTPPPTTPTVSAPAPTAPPVSAPPPVAAVVASSSPAEVEVVVVAGDNLWELAARHLASTSARARVDVGDAEVAPYWARVCDANRDRLASGDPNLVYPGERVLLPPPA